MDIFNSDRFSQQECVADFHKLFPQGFAGEDVIAEIAPEGWPRSPMVAIFHPSLEQVFQEAVESHQNLQRLRLLGDRQVDGKEDVEPPTIEQVRERFQETPVDTLREVAELAGRCVWDIFSDNHDVRGADQRVMDIGSFRGAGGFIADELNQQLGECRYDYMDFFMGTSWITCRADDSVVYEMIFRRLKRRGLDWNYSFPKLLLIDLQPLRDSIESGHEPRWSDYSPELALARERDEQKRQQRLAETRRRMDEDHVGFVAEARSGPPPRIVAAYQNVYGHPPRGWPPTTS